MTSMVSCRVYYASVHTPDSKDRPDKQSVQKMLSLAEEHKIDLEVSIMLTAESIHLWQAQSETET